MANPITVKVGFVFEPVDYSGQLCRVCEDPIYGKGYNMIMTTNVNGDPVPKFHDKNIIVCCSCKNAYDNN